MFKISITSRAERELKRLDRPVKNRIVSAISALASDPRPPGCLSSRPARSFLVDLSAQKLHKFIKYLSLPACQFGEGF
jgi:hypothetical protein